MQYTHCYEAAECTTQKKEVIVTDQYCKCPIVQSYNHDTI